jgi:hypothetical protein
MMGLLDDNKLKDALQSFNKSIESLPNIKPSVLKREGARVYGVDNEAIKELAEVSEELGLYDDESE